MCFVNYSYLAIRLERSASFASLIRLYVNSGFSFVWLIRMQHVALVSQNKKMCYLRHNSGNMGHKIYNNSNNFNQQHCAGEQHTPVLGEKKGNYIRVDSTMYDVTQIM